MYKNRGRFCGETSDFFFEIFDLTGEQRDNRRGAGTKENRSKSAEFTLAPKEGRSGQLP